MSSNLHLSDPGSPRLHFMSQASLLVLDSRSCKASDRMKVLHSGPFLLAGCKRGPPSLAQPPGAFTVAGADLMGTFDSDAVGRHFLSAGVSGSTLTWQDMVLSVNIGGAQAVKCSTPERLLACLTTYTAVADVKLGMSPADAQISKIVHLLPLCPISPRLTVLVDPVSLVLFQSDRVPEMIRLRTLSLLCLC